MRHVTHINVSCHTYKCVMSHISMRHINASSCTWVVPLINLQNHPRNAQPETLYACTVNAWYTQITYIQMSFSHQKNKQNMFPPKVSRQNFQKSTHHIWPKNWCPWRFSQRHFFNTKKITNAYRKSKWTGEKNHKKNHIYYADVKRQTPCAEDTSKWGGGNIQRTLEKLVGRE